MDNCYIVTDDRSLWLICLQMAVMAAVCRAIIKSDRFAIAFAITLPVMIWIMTQV